MFQFVGGFPDSVFFFLPAIPCLVPPLARRTGAAGYAPPTLEYVHNYYPGITETCRWFGGEVHKILQSLGLSPLEEMGAKARLPRLLTLPY